METIQKILDLVQSGALIPIVTGVIATFSAIAAITPTPKKGSKLGIVYKIIDFLAVNIGKAKDKGDDKPE
ncbi:hypothetical protein N9955_01060 [bacterium]|nr:hypothetical protein [bacterium]